jgi:uncharacterized delta-60 repeat protein
MIRLAACSVAFLVSVQAHSQEGRLDSSFGKGGWIEAPAPLENKLDEGAGAVLPLPDGSVIVVMTAGKTVLQRYHKNGTRDVGFGQAGFSVPVDLIEPRAVLQTDGAILVSGHVFTAAGADFKLGRYTQNGYPDSSFDGDGWLSTDFDSLNNKPTAMAIQGDGKIVVAGTHTGDEHSALNGTALARYNKDGSLDAGFGLGGKLVTTMLVGHAVAIQQDGKIVIAGFSDVAGTGADFTLLRLHADGAPDKSFGKNGKITTDIYNGGNDVAFAVAIDGQQNIIAGGLARKKNSQSADFCLLRYTPAGALDKAFDDDGKATTGFGRSDEAIAMLVQPDGAIVLAGTTASGIGADADFAVARYHPNGSPDLSFNGDGQLTTDFFGGADVLAAIALYNDGTLIAAGAAANRQKENQDGALARYDAAGNLDAAFGDGGRQTSFYPFGDASFKGVCIQPDGKILVAAERDPNIPGTPSDFVVARYHKDGSQDTSFGEHGTVSTDFFGRNDRAAAIAVQANGKILVAGTARNAGTDLDEFALVRYGADGLPDPLFGKLGRATLGIAAGAAEAVAVLLQPDEKILVAGTVFTLGSGYDFALVRFQPNGTLDSSFGINGTAITDVAGSAEMLRAIALGADGKIAAAGYAANQPVGYDVALVRYHPNGLPDLSFDGDGKLTKDISGGDDYANALAIQNDGKIVVAGGSMATTISFVNTLARFNSDGSPDNSFDEDGVQTTAFSGFSVVSAAMALQHDGAIITAGTAYNPAKGTGAIAARYLANGRLDSAFGDGGRAVTLLAGDEQANAIALTTNRVYAAGATRSIGRAGLVIAYTLSNPGTVSSFTLVNAVSGKDIKTLQEGDVINLADVVGRSINIRANVASGGSVIMQLSGAETHQQVENLFPYALFGGTEDNYNNWRPVPGSYVLEATPYAGAKGSGAAGTPLRVRFSITDNLTLAGFTLVNAQTNKDLGPLADGQVIDLAVTPFINIRVNTGTGITQSVRFGVNGNAAYELQNSLPFAIASDNKGDYLAWRVSTGTYAITATPYSQNGAKGAAGQPLSITIHIINTQKENTSIAQSNREQIHTGTLLYLHAFPNPASTTAYIEYGTARNTNATILLTDASGRIVQQVFSGQVWGGITNRKELSISGLAPGIYFCQLITRKGERSSVKLVKQ